MNAVSVGITYLVVLVSPPHTKEVSMVLSHFIAHRLLQPLTHATTTGLKAGFGVSRARAAPHTPHRYKESP
jgi:hypothetical protein